MLLLCQSCRSDRKRSRDEMGRGRGKGGGEVGGGEGAVLLLPCQSYGSGRDSGRQDGGTKSLMVCSTAHWSIINPQFVRLVTSPAVTAASTRPRCRTAFHTDKEGGGWKETVGGRGGRGS